MSSGSGVIISKDGYIVTNNHVVENADELEVTLSNNRHYRAEVIGTDPDNPEDALKQDGTSFWTGQQTTKAPSGSFEVRKLASDRAGVHTFVGRAVNPTTGEVCRGSARI